MVRQFGTRWATQTSTSPELWSPAQDASVFSSTQCTVSWAHKRSRKSPTPRAVPFTGFPLTAPFRSRRFSARSAPFSALPCTLRSHSLIECTTCIWQCAITRYINWHRVTGRTGSSNRSWLIRQKGPMNSGVTRNSETRNPANILSELSPQAAQSAPPYIDANAA